MGNLFFHDFRTIHDFMKPTILELYATANVLTILGLNS